MKMTTTVIIGVYALSLCAVALPACAQSDDVYSDTVWVETICHRQLRTKYEAANQVLSVRASELNASLRWLSAVRITGYSTVSLSTIGQGEPSKVVVTWHDRDRMHHALIAERDSLRTAFNANFRALAVLEAQLRRGKYYLRSTVPGDSVSSIRADIVDSLLALQATTPNAMQYTRYDWLRWHLGGARIAQLRRKKE